MILIKEEFVGGEKYRRAVELGGSDAIVLWLALKRYCSLYPDTEGFIPAEEVDNLPGVPRGWRRKAMPALIGCGRLLPGGERGKGFVEVVERGWLLHDYLDHVAPPEEIELRREKARLRKQSWRESKRRELDAVRRFAGELGDPPLLAHPLGGEDAGQGRDTERDSPGDSPGDSDAPVSGDTLAGARPPEPAPARTPTRAPAQPSPALSSPTKKSLQSLASRIRDPLAPIEPCPEHRQFAAEQGIELAPLLAELQREAAAECLSNDEIRARLAARLASLASFEQRRIGGAA